MAIVSQPLSVPARSVLNTYGKQKGQRQYHSPATGRDVSAALEPGSFDRRSLLSAGEGRYANTESGTFFNHHGRASEKLPPTLAGQALT